MRKRLAVILLSTLGLAPALACADVIGPKIAPLPEARRPVAILSILGNRMVGIARGMFASDTKQDVVEVDWSIDRLMIDEIARAVGDRYAPRGIELDRKAVIEASFKGRSMFSGAEELVDALRKTVQPGTVDLILVVRHTAIQDPFTGVNAGVWGYGVYSAAAIFSGDIGRAYIVCSILAVDGTRMKELGERECQGTGAFMEPRVPFRKLDEAMTKARLPAYTPEQQRWLREALQAMVVETVPLTLAKLKLTPEPAREPGAAPERPPPEESTR